MRSSCRTNWKVWPGRWESHKGQPSGLAPASTTGEALFKFSIICFLNHKNTSMTASLVLPENYVK